MHATSGCDLDGSETRTSAERRRRLPDHAWCVGHHAAHTRAPEVAQVVIVESADERFSGLASGNAHDERLAESLALQGHHRHVSEGGLHVLWLGGHNEHVWLVRFAHLHVLKELVKPGSKEQVQGTGRSRATERGCRLSARADQAPTAGSGALCDAEVGKMKILAEKV